MNILFLTIAYSTGHNIYSDLMNEFKRHGHNVFVVCQTERRNNEDTNLSSSNGINILKVKTGNLTGKVSLVEKGITTLSIEYLFEKAIKKYTSDIKFDLVIYSTPPITFADVVSYVKNRDGAASYLLLKDIFPQNAVDLGMIKKDSLLHKYFRHKERVLYKLSDYIGCMSDANVKYVLENNAEVNPSKVEVCPNSIEVFDKSITAEDRKEIRNKYGIPEDKLVFIYGGNLGKPQGIDFLIDCLISQKENEKVFFLVVGDGSEYKKMSDFYGKNICPNFKLMKKIPKEDYDTLVAACDVGMIFLDHRFTIPNFPSRLLSYMQAKLPVLACTDTNTDIGKVITENSFGWWCESNNSDSFSALISSVEETNLKGLGMNAYNCLIDMYSVKKSLQQIVNKTDIKL